MASGIVESSQSGSDQQPQQNQPIARQRLVQRLLAASANLPNFINDLILTQAHVVAGTEAAAFLIEPAAPPPETPETSDTNSAQAGDAPPEAKAPQFRLKPVAHIRPDNSDSETRAAALAAFQEIIAPCVEQNKDGAIQIDGTNDGSESQYCLVNLLRADGNPVAVSAVITRSRDLQRATQRLDLMSIVGGYFELFTLRRTSEQTRSVAQSHQHVLQLQTAVATADGFESSAMNLCNELATRSGAARVSLGWVKGNHIKLKALSHTEQFDKKQELSVALVKVMEECWDNDEIVQYEPEGTTTNTITREAAALSRSQGGETILSLPLRRKGDVVGIITLEFAPTTKIGPQAATGLAVAVELLAPQLYDRYQNDRYLITKVGLSIEELGKKTIGPKYMLAKTIVSLVIAALLFVTLYQPMYHVSAPFQFTPIEKRAFSAPFDGAVLKEVNFKPGESVEAGQVLLQFDDTDLRLQRSKFLADANKAAQEEVTYRADPAKTAEMQMAQQDKLSAQAQADYYQELIDRAKIVAPFKGAILTAADFNEKRGSVFKQGEPLIEIAKSQSFRIEIAVDERDIQDVKIGAHGTLATTSLPNDPYPFKVERIVPAGVSKEGTNVFTVYGTPEKVSDQWSSGLKGEVRIDTTNRRLIWIWTHRFTDFVRIKLWI